MTGRFMAADVAAVSLAVLLFPLVTAIPGYLLAWLLDVFGFRRRGIPGRAAIAIPFSIGIAPLLFYLLSRYVPAATMPFCAACAVGFAMLSMHERRQLLTPAALRSAWSSGALFLAIGLGWMVLAVALLVDLQIGQRLYFPSVTADYMVRSAITSAITTTGVPPRSPFFHMERYFTLRYHYFWFIPCSIVQRLAGGLVSGRQATIAGTVWSGAGLLALIPLYTRFFGGASGAAGAALVRKRTLIGIFLLTVTGLDLLPVIALERITGILLPSLEWWNEAVSSWANAVFWLPHHVAGTIACMTGFLILWYARDVSSARDRIVLATAAGAIFASALGLSIFVTAVFAVGMALWIPVALLRGERRHAGLIAVAGVAALLLSIPYLTELFGETTGPRRGFPIVFAVRPLGMIDVILGIQNPFGWRANLTNLALLPLHYVLEFGFFLIVGAVQCRRMWRDRTLLTPERVCALTIAATSLLVCTVVRSSVIGSNDLGMRGMLIAQFVLLLWGAEMLSGAGGRGARKALLCVTLTVGIAGSAYEVFKIRFYPMMTDVTNLQVPYLWVSRDRQLGARTYAVRGMYEELKTLTRVSDVVQHNPNTNPEDPFHGMYADRQVATARLDCAVVFGGDESLCARNIGPLDDLFERPGAVAGCEGLGIDVAVVKDTDPAWADRSSWVWKRTPMIANRYARAFDCGGSGDRISMRR